MNLWDLLWDRRTEGAAWIYGIEGLKVFKVRTAQSRQKLNVYKKVKQVQSHVWIYIIRYEPYASSIFTLLQN